MKKKAATVIMTCIAIMALQSSASAKTDPCTYYKDYIIDVCEDYYICPELVMAIINVNEDQDNLMGLDASILEENIDRLDIKYPYEDRSNILLGVDYLSSLSEQYEDLPLVLMVYGGADNAMELYEAKLYNQYAKDVMDMSYGLERAHGK